MTKEQHLQKATQELLDKGDVYDKILAYYMNSEVELLPKEKKVLKRWETAWGLTLDGNSPETIKTILVREFDISDRTAYRDMSNAEKLYGSVRKSSLEGKMAALYELAHKVFKKAMEDGKWMAANVAWKNLKEAAEKIESLSTMNDKIEAHQYVFQINVKGGEEETIDIDFESMDPEQRKMLNAHIDDMGISQKELLDKMIEEQDDEEAI